MVKRYFYYIMTLLVMISTCLTGCVERRDSGYTTTIYNDGYQQQFSENVGVPYQPYSAALPQPYQANVNSLPSSGVQTFPVNARSVTTRYEHNSSDNSWAIIGGSMILGAAILTLPDFIRAVSPHKHHRWFRW